MNTSKEFIEYLIRKREQITPETLEKAKNCLIDYMAVTEAGAAANKDLWSSYLMQTGTGNALLIGYARCTDGKTAALINGFNAHSLELDDGQRFAMIHLGSSIISALLAAQAEHSIEKTALLTGIILGYEAACRAALSIQPSHKKLGFHTAGTCGTIGAAIGVAFALEMNREQLQVVLACAAASSAGLLEMQEQSSQLKPFNVGRAAMDGLAAAYMGYTPFAAPDDILNGRRGFLKLFSREVNPAKLMEMTEYFELERIYIKPYAACRHCHSAIEAAMALREQVDLKDICEVRVSTYNLAVLGHDHTLIEGVSSAKLSIPYSVAAALCLGKCDVSAFSYENVNNPEILEITRKVKVLEDPEYSAVCTQKRIANVSIVTNAGTVYTHTVEYAKGEPENPMTRAEVIEKARALTGDAADDIVNYVLNEQKGSV